MAVFSRILGFFPGKAATAVAALKAVEKLLDWIMTFMQNTSDYMGLDPGATNQFERLPMPPTFLYLPPGIFNDTSSNNGPGDGPPPFPPHIASIVLSALNKFMVEHPQIYSLTIVVASSVLTLSTFVAILEYRRPKKLPAPIPIPISVAPTPAEESTCVLTPFLPLEAEKKGIDDSLLNSTYAFLFGINRQSTPVIRRYADTGRSPGPSNSPTFYGDVPFYRAPQRLIEGDRLGLGITISSNALIRAQFGNAVQVPVIVNQVEIPDALEDPAVAEHVQSAVEEVAAEKSYAEVGVSVDEEIIAQRSYAETGVGSEVEEKEDLAVVVVEKMEMGVQAELEDPVPAIEISYAEVGTSPDEEVATSKSYAETAVGPDAVEEESEEEQNDVAIVVEKFEMGVQAEPDVPAAETVVQKSYADAEIGTDEGLEEKNDSVAVLKAEMGVQAEAEVPAEEAVVPKSYADAGVGLDEELEEKDDAPGVLKAEMGVQAETEIPVAETAVQKSYVDAGVGSDEELEETKDVPVVVLKADMAVQAESEVPAVETTVEKSYADAGTGPDEEIEEKNDTPAVLKAEMGVQVETVVPAAETTIPKSYADAGVSVDEELEETKDAPVVLRAEMAVQAEAELPAVQKFYIDAGGIGPDEELEEKNDSPLVLKAEMDVQVEPESPAAETANPKSYADTGVGSDEGAEEKNDAIVVMKAELGVQVEAEIPATEAGVQKYYAEAGVGADEGVTEKDVPVVIAKVEMTVQTEPEAAPICLHCPHCRAKFEVEQKVQVPDIKIAEEPEVNTQGNDQVSAIGIEEQEVDQAPPEADDTFELPYEEMAKYESLFNEPNPESFLPPIDYQADFDLKPEVPVVVAPVVEDGDSFVLTVEEAKKFEYLMDIDLNKVLPEEDYFNVIPEEMDPEYREKAMETMKKKQSEWAAKKERRQQEDLETLKFLLPIADQIESDFRMYRLEAEKNPATPREIMQFCRKREKEIRKEKAEKEARLEDTNIRRKLKPYMKEIRKEFKRRYPDGDEAQLTKFLREEVWPVRQEIFAAQLNKFLEANEDASEEDVQAFLLKLGEEEKNYRAAREEYEVMKKKVFEGAVLPFLEAHPEATEDELSAFIDGLR